MVDPGRLQVLPSPRWKSACRRKAARKGQGVLKGRPGPDGSPRVGWSGSSRPPRATWRPRPGGRPEPWAEDEPGSASMESCAGPWLISRTTVPPLGSGSPPWIQGTHGASCSPGYRYRRTGCGPLAGAPVSIGGGWVLSLARPGTITRGVPRAPVSGRDAVSGRWPGYRPGGPG